jgi:hypothetical protein
MGQALDEAAKQIVREGNLNGGKSYAGLRRTTPTWNFLCQSAAAGPLMIEKLFHLLGRNDMKRLKHRDWHS